MAAIPTKIAGASTWLVVSVALLIVYIAYRNYDQNGTIFNFSP